MNRTPRNVGQSFSTASVGVVAVVVAVVVVTEAVIIVVIVMAGVGFMAKGLLVPFPVLHSVSHIESIWLLLVARAAAAVQIVVFRTPHVSCVKINRNSTVPKVSGTSFTSKSGRGGWGGGGGYSIK